MEFTSKIPCLVAVLILSSCNNNTEFQTSAHILLPSNSIYKIDYVVESLSSRLNLSVSATSFGLKNSSNRQLVYKLDDVQTLIFIQSETEDFCDIGNKVEDPKMSKYLFSVNIGSSSRDIRDNTLRVLELIASSANSKIYKDSKVLCSELRN